jgi:hypothetical protein
VTALLEKPQKSKTKLTIMYREHKELLERLAPDEKTRVLCCAAKLINYFGRWQDWKKSLYPTDWIYQPLQDIRKDLLDEHSVHVIRDAIALLERLGLLSKRKNSRADNWRNGQDRTYQYRLHISRLESDLERLFSNSAPETIETNPLVRSESPTFNIESPTFGSEFPAFIVEQYTQITSIIPATDSCSVSEARENLEFLAKEGDECEVPWKSITSECQELEQEELKPHFDKNQVEEESLPQERLEAGEDNYSAATPHNKSKYVSSGFVSQEEENGFYRALLELGKKMSGVQRPRGWAISIIRSVKNGEPCAYLDEYRRGQLVGAGEQREWEVAPGQPHPRFIRYLKERLMKNGMTPEQAIDEAFKKLRDVNEASSLWESCKRTITNLQDEWEKQQAWGVSSAYIPPELRPEREVSEEEAAIAMHQLQANCVKVPALAPSGTDLLPAAQPMSLLESAETQEKALPTATVEESAPGADLSEPMPLDKVQETLNRGRIGETIARLWLRANPHWGYVIVDGLVVIEDGSPLPLAYLQWLYDCGGTNRARVMRLLNQKKEEWSLCIEDNQVKEIPF